MSRLSADVRMYGVSADLGTARTMRVVQTEFSHDMATIMFNNMLADAALSTADAPTSLSWSYGPFSASMYGKIDVSSPQRSKIAASGTVGTVVYVLGASSDMRDSHQRSWTSASLETIVADVLSPYMFSYEVDSYAYKIAFVSQSGDESDWQFLVRLSQMIGYSLVADNTNVRLIDTRAQLRRDVGAGCPVFTLPDNVSDVTNVTDFKVRMTSTPYDSDYKRTRLVGVSGTGYPFEYRTAYTSKSSEAGVQPSISTLSSVHFDSLEQAVAEAERIVGQARYTITATLESNGLPTVKAGRYVFIEDQRGPFQGYWYVIEADHTMTFNPDKYRTSLTLCREALDGDRSHVVGLRVRESPPATVYSGTRWRALHQWGKVHQ